MTITLNKFGTVLTSRQAGREALAAFMPTLLAVKSDEQIILDFAGIATLSPSWADEFITPLVEKYGSRLRMLSTQNPSVEVTLRVLQLTIATPQPK